MRRGTSLGRSGCKVAPRALRILLCPLPLRQRWLATFAVPTAMKRDRRTRRWARRFLTQLSKFVKDYYPGIASLSVGWYGGEPLLGMKMIERITSDLKDVVGPTCEYSASMASVLPSRHSSYTQFSASTQNACRRMTRCRVSSASGTKAGTTSKTFFKLRALSFCFCPKVRGGSPLEARWRRKRPF